MERSTLEVLLLVLSVILGIIRLGEYLWTLWKYWQKKKSKPSPHDDLPLG